MDDREEYKTKVPNFKENHIGKIAISYGWDDEDYVLHISTTDTRIPFRVDQRTLIMEIIKLLKKVIPDTVKVDIFTPSSTWELSMYTVKAWMLKRCWQVNEKMIEDLIKNLFAKLNTLA